MIVSYVRRILKLGPLMGDMAVSAAGCFVFIRGFRVVVLEQERPNARSSVRTEGVPRMPLVGISAALFLLAFVASEAAATVVALHR